MQLSPHFQLDGSKSSVAVRRGAIGWRRASEAKLDMPREPGLRSTLVSFNIVLAISSIEKCVVSMNGIPSLLYSASTANGSAIGSATSAPHSPRPFPAKHLLPKQVEQL